MHDEKVVPERLERFTRTATMQDDKSFLKALEAEEKVASIARLSIACLLFIVFWVVCKLPSHFFCRSKITSFRISKAGSAVFMATEGWGMGTAAYFCKYRLAACSCLTIALIRYSGFTTFSTVGYGEISLTVINSTS